MEKKKISVSKTARYFQAGSISNKTKNVWFVFHGYGMLSEFFIKKFESLVDSETIIIAPEATSRFYLEGKYERVGLRVPPPVNIACVLFSSKVTGILLFKSLSNNTLDDK